MLHAKTEQRGATERTSVASIFRSTRNRFFLERNRPWGSEVASLPPHTLSVSFSLGSRKGLVDFPLFHSHVIGVFIVANCKLRVDPLSPALYVYARLRAPSARRPRSRFDSRVDHALAHRTRAHRRTRESDPRVSLRATSSESARVSPLATRISARTARFGELLRKKVEGLEDY